MRMPNGYGGITKLPGKRRNPYRVRVTVGWDIDEKTGKSRQVYRTVGYFPSFEEANRALAAYHQNPLSLEPGITFADLYSRWSEERYETASQALIKSYTAAFKAVPMLHGIEFRKLKRNHLQNAVDTCGKGYATLQNVKILFGLLYKYAIQNDLAEKDYSQFVDLKKHKPDPDETPSIHTVITPDELSKLWSSPENDTVRETLMLIYSGLRISEFCALTRSDVNVNARIVTIRKSKTIAGRRRVPIASKTLDFWRDYKFPEGELMESDVRSKTTSYRKRLKKEAPALGIEEHLPHDTRHTCATMLHAARVDGYTVKRILGHADTDVTENVYTHLSDDLLIEAIDKI